MVGANPTFLLRYLNLVQTLIFTEVPVSETFFWGAGVEVVILNKKNTHMSSELGKVYH